MDSLTCPNCQHKLNDATCLSIETPDAKPVDGDISSCLYCGTAITYVEKDGVVTLRILTPEEIADLPPDLRHILSCAVSIGVVMRAKLGAT